jgi:hypothetical protein
MAQGYSLRKQLRQLDNVHSNPPCLIFAEQLGRRAPTGLAFIIEVAQRLPVGVTHDEAVGRYLGSPERREAGGHDQRSKCELQVLFYRGISDRYVDQSSILKPRDDLVVFDRIERDATGAPPEHAIIFGTKSSGGVLVRVDNPFVRRRVANVTVVRGDPIEH